ncbi:NUDIX hydrolase [Lacisediminihabitans profunda]|uniref:NUDIX hydrolase n=1 Tax=Lacisediminihabitans profunda TaxID=2594790 RepID=UPI00319E96FD
MIVLGPSRVYAAGALCWRIVDGETLILLVHREERADISLPKGKVDPGETPPQTAVREIAEETGLSIALGAPLGTIEYTLPGGREKTVFYWSAEVSEETIAASTFAPNDEIAALHWMSIDSARDVLSYERDRDVLDRFAERVAAGNARTFPIIALRHGKAVPPASWDGPDSTRPLLHRGLEQSESVAPAIAAWGPKKLISSTAVRCLATIEPVAALTGLLVKRSVSISQDAYEDGTSRVRKVVRKRLQRREAVVLCSHGPVLPEIIDAIADATGTPLDAPLRRAGMLATSEFTVLHLSVEQPDGGIVAVETHGPAVF